MISRHRYFDKALLWACWLLLSNFLVVGGTELAHDEAYYWMFSRRLDWGYFDHPPMAAWWIALTSWIPGEWGVRLSFVAGLQMAAWLTADLVPSERRWQVWAGFNAFPLLAFMGVFAIPDGPLVAMSALWVWTLKKSLKQNDIAWGVAMGLASALLLYAKYHGVLFMVATLLALPRLLLRPSFWIAMTVALIAFLPHVWWQYAHGFATFQYHFIDRPSSPSGLKSIAEYLLLQVFLPGLFLAPLLWKTFFTNKSETEFERALKCMAIFVPLFFLLSAFSKRIEGNWTVAAAIPFLVFVVRKQAWESPWHTRLLMISVVIVGIAKVAIVLPPSWHGLTRGNELHGWREWAQVVKAKSPDCALVANKYQIASKLSFYLGEEIPALNVGTRLNQFEFWDLDKKLMGSPVCWATNHYHIFPGESVPTPTGGGVLLVKGIPLSDILSHKQKEL
jgi:hypothetical protein